jgi:hypothetical protein
MSRGVQLQRCISSRASPSRARTIFTFDDHKLPAHCRQMTPDGEVCLGVLCALQFLAVGDLLWRERAKYLAMVLIGG